MYEDSVREFKEAGQKFKESIGVSGPAGGASFLDRFKEVSSQINNSMNHIKTWIEQSTADLEAMGVSHDVAKEAVSYVLMSSNPKDTLEAIKNVIRDVGREPVSQGYKSLMDELRGPTDVRKVKKNRKSRRAAKRNK